MPYKDRQTSLEYRRRWRKENPERAAAYQRMYYRENKNGTFVRTNAKPDPSKKDKPKQIEMQGLSRENRLYKKSKQNKKRLKTYSGKQRARKAETNKASYLRRMADADVRKKWVEQAKEWRKRNPEKRRAISAHAKKVRRARKAGAICDVRSGDMKRLLESQNGKCVYCKVDLDDTKHLDHRMPLALGGNHVLDNLQYLCAPCNISKGAMPPEEFEGKIGFRRET